MKTPLISLMVFCCLAALHSAGVSLYGGLQNKKTAVPQAGMAADPWESLRFLVGEWVGVEGTGQPGEAISGGTSFAFDLGDKILVRKNRADYAPKPGEQTGISHQDLLILYQLTGETEIRGFYVDNEGHAINYLVTSPGKGKAVFESAESKTGPRYRLDYELNADRALTITFSIAMPGTTYTVYTRGTAHRK